MFVKFVSVIMCLVNLIEEEIWGIMLCWFICGPLFNMAQCYEDFSHSLDLPLSYTYMFMTFVYMLPWKILLLHKYMISLLWVLSLPKSKNGLNPPITYIRPVSWTYSFPILFMFTNELWIWTNLNNAQKHALSLNNSVYW